MKRLVKGLVLVVCLMVMLNTMSVVTMAASIVTRIKISVEENGDKSYPTVSIESDKYHIAEESSWSKTEAQLKPGDKIYKTIIVEPADGYEIRLKNGKYDITLSNKKSTTVKSYTRNKATYKIELEYTVQGMLEEPECWWDSDKPWIACTNEQTHAEYEFVMYQNNREIARISKKNASCNFDSYLASKEACEKSDVYFTVRVRYNGLKSDWAYSEEFTNWNELWYYCRDNNIRWKGTKLEKPNDDNYSNNSKPNSNPGYNSTEPLPDTPGNWVQQGESWYFYEQNIMKKGCFVVKNNKKYYIAEDGKMVTGQMTIDNKTYYFNDNISNGPLGSALTGLQTINGDEYYFFPNNGKDNFGRAYFVGQRAENIRVHFPEKLGDPNSPIIEIRMFGSDGKCQWIHQK